MPSLELHNSPSRATCTASLAVPMAFSLGSRSLDREDMDGEGEACVGTGSDGSSDSSSDGYQSELESMTGKGIKRLCTELLELKRVSDEDFQQNVRLRLSSFIRIFDEIGGVGSEIMTIKKHILTQDKLVHNLLKNPYLEIVSQYLLDIKSDEVEDLDQCLPSRFEVHGDGILETLDILISEQRTDEALIVLEKETKTLQKLQMEEHLFLSVGSYMSAISDRRARLTGQLALVAMHPRVSQPELRKALYGLCRLGENNRANLLLIKFYHSHLERCLQELHSSTTFQHETYIIMLSKVVFSIISQAARSFVILYGEASYTSEFIQWARIETEAFSHRFDKYVKSISEIEGGLSLTVEAVGSALKFCDLLMFQNMCLQPHLIKLIRPCIEEILQTRMYHFKEVISTFTRNDTWVLSKFLISGILKDKSSSTVVGGEIKYCLLTNSGIKFITLIQEIFDEISPLIILQIDSSILKGLTDLFDEYMHTLVNAIPNHEKVSDNDIPRISSTQELQHEISLLVNSSTLVYFFPLIASSIFKDTKPSNIELSPEHREHFPQNELDEWMLSILGATDRLRSCFCQKFVHDVMSPAKCYLQASQYLDGDVQFILSTAEIPMPSSGFQALFLQLRQLEFSKSILAGEDGLMKMLLVELMETVVVWLSNNQEFWKRTSDSTSVPQFSCFEQVHIDMHFLLEFAKCGGYFSDDILAAAMDLIAQIRATATESEPNSVVPDDKWASKAAKFALEKLLEILVAMSETEEPVPSLGEKLGIKRFEDAEPNVEDNDTLNSKDYTILGDDESVKSVQKDVQKSSETMIIQLESQKVNLENAHSDEEGLRNPGSYVTSVEDGLDLTEFGVGKDMHKIGRTKVCTIEGTAMIPESDSVRDSVGCITNRDLIVLQETVKTGIIEVELCGTSDPMALTIASEVTASVGEAEISEISLRLDFITIHSGSSDRTMLTSGNELLVPDKMDITIVYSNNPQGTMMAHHDLTASPCSKEDRAAFDAQLEGTVIDLEHKTVHQGEGMNSFSAKADCSDDAMSKELLQDNFLIVSEEAPVEVDFFETSNNLGVIKSLKTEIDKLADVSDKLNATVKKPERIMTVHNDLSAGFYSEGDGRCSDTLPEEGFELDSGNKFIMLQSGEMSGSNKADSSSFTTLEEAGQNISQRLGSETTEYKGNEPDQRGKHQGTGGSNIIVAGTKTSREVVRPKVRRERPYYASTTESSDKNRMGPRVIRPKWH